jgi:hypothetical protein
MEILVAGIVLAAVVFYVATTAYLVAAVALGWVCRSLAWLLRPVLRPIVRVLDYKLW